MKLAAAVAALLLASAPAFAEEPPHTYALVSAIGSTLLYVKPRFSTGTHMDPWQRAEMKVPGQAWLQWELAPATRGSVLAQTAIFAPRGLAGALYWHLLYPVHKLIFSAMARAIARAAEAPDA